MLRCMSTETLRLMGFRFGEIAKLSVNQYNSKHQDEQVKVLLAKIRDRYQSKDGTKKIKKDNVNEAKQTRNKTSKLHVGWLHSNDGSKYVQKRLCDGGGTRELLVCVNEMTFDSLKERMISIFLGHSSKLYEVKIGNFKREIIQSFRDLNNEECSLKTYMTDHGLFASKFRLYLMTTSVMDAEFIESNPSDLKCDILSHVPNSDHVFGTDPTFTEKSKTTSVMDAEIIDSNPPYLKSDILAHVPNSDHVFGTDPTFTEKSKTTSVMDADFIESNPPELKSDILDHVPNSNAMFTENPLSTQEPVDILQNSDPEMNLDNNRSKTHNLSIEHLSCDRPIDVTFVKYYQPEHDTEIILRQSCFSREECYKLTTGILHHDQKLEEYNPFDDNYELRTITVGNELLLSEECQDDRTLRYLLKPKIDAHNTNSLIAYHPKDVCGFFETELIIGVILVEKQSVAHYTWYRNNKIYAGGVGLACIWVYEPGT
ncbi:hypothetical protein SNE40_011216 [Patella caerulea]|uniref:Uncharacterized protein n=1 Tax=Patella caerulea TaxID=87958 RepID=A0AAN8JL24_PATCE